MTDARSFKGPLEVAPVYHSSWKRVIMGEELSSTFKFN